ncbi:anti-sigma factor family protein [Planctomicrobium piriforme]|uniref:Putative zinc-finger n=1 Tax=Planctomicrobium piriforme TaxID=1576369 RepID=A0A1I3DM98_9PLAN|nr:zf-HC2 domain-containing protein [Planctomicrobium piriforme]SFH87678.1 Putative zinc-finger [Planctomicrobium piriforme]
MSHFTEDLLSAYLDGELTPSQRADVERQLAERPALREQLGELRELSAALRRLPRPAAPADFQASVLSALDALSKPLPTTAVTTRRATRFASRWTAVVCAGLVLTVVGGSILVPTQWLARPEMHQDFARTDGAVPALKQLAPASPQLAESLSMGGTGATAPQLNFGTTINATEPTVPVVQLTAEQIRAKIETLGYVPQVGNSIKVPAQLVTEQGETPIVVVFTVVDVMQAMNQMQVLVHKGQIRSQDNRMLSRDFKADGIAPLTAVSLELEMNGPEMASVLNSVPALDAVLYMPEEPRPEALSAALAESPVPTQSLGLADKQTARAATVSRGVEQPVQFRFDQLALTESAKQENIELQNAPVAPVVTTLDAAGKAKDVPQTSEAETKAMSQAAAPNQERFFAGQSLASKNANAPTHAHRYRAFIVIQQQPVPAAPASPELK